MDRSICALVLGFLAVAACSDPKCPRVYIQRDNVCRRCPEGTVPVDNECVPVEGDAAAATGDAGEESEVDPSEADDAGAAQLFPDGTTLSESMPDGMDGGQSDAGMPEASADGSAQADAAMGQADADAAIGSDADLAQADADAATRSDAEAGGAGCEGQALANACGGPCTAALAHAPGETCNNGLMGACTRDGMYVCAGTTTTVCNAPSAPAGVEVCGDGVDNDCDGAADEADAADATLWYPDCDGDSFASSSPVRACVKPATDASCAAYFVAAPAPAATDCDDTSTAYQPGSLDYLVPPEGKTSHDFNCDGVVEKLAGAKTVGGPPGPPSMFTWTCAAGATCSQCYENLTCPQVGGICYAGSYASQWTDPTGNIVVAAPPCSTSTDDRRPLRMAAKINCTSPESQPPWSWAASGGLQLCR